MAKHSKSTHRSSPDRHSSPRDGYSRNRRPSPHVDAHQKSNRSPVYRNDIASKRRRVNDSGENGSNRGAGGEARSDDRGGGRRSRDSLSASPNDDDRHTGNRSGRNDGIGHRRDRYTEERTGQYRGIPKDDRSRGGSRGQSPYDRRSAAYDDRGSVSPGYDRPRSRDGRVGSEEGNGAKYDAGRSPGVSKRSRGSSRRHDERRERSLTPDSPRYVARGDSPVVNRQVRRSDNSQWGNERVSEHRSGAMRGDSSAGRAERRRRDDVSPVQQSRSLKHQSRDRGYSRDNLIRPSSRVGNGREKHSERKMIVHSRRLDKGSSLNVYIKPFGIEAGHEKNRRMENRGQHSDDEVKSEPRSPTPREGPTDRRGDISERGKGRVQDGRYGGTGDKRRDNANRYEDDVKSEPPSPEQRNTSSRRRDDQRHRGKGRVNGAGYQEDVKSEPESPSPRRSSRPVAGRERPEGSRSRGGREYVDDVKSEPSDSEEDRRETCRRAAEKRRQGTGRLSRSRGQSHGRGGERRDSRALSQTSDGSGRNAHPDGGSPRSKRPRNEHNVGYDDDGGRRRQRTRTGSREVEDRNNRRGRSREEFRQRSAARDGTRHESNRYSSHGLESGSASPDNRVASSRDCGRDDQRDRDYPCRPASGAHDKSQSRHRDRDVRDGRSQGRRDRSPSFVGRSPDAQPVKPTYRDLSGCAAKRAQNDATHRQRVAERDADGPSGSGGGPPRRPRGPRGNKDGDDDNFDWGRPDAGSGPGSKADGPSTSGPAGPPADDKRKPNFELSGKLTEDTNKFNGVVVGYNEPPEARKPTVRYRLYPFKGEESLPVMYVHRQSAYLIGRERRVADLPIDHPSCSKQHAVLQYRMTTFKVPGPRSEDSDAPTYRTKRAVRPYIIDLESANGTYLNNNRIDAKRYYELKEGDMVKFGFSSREYILLHENSDAAGGGGQKAPVNVTP